MRTARSCTQARRAASSRCAARGQPPTSRCPRAAPIPPGAPARRSTHAASKGAASQDADLVIPPALARRETPPIRAASHDTHSVHPRAARSSPRTCGRRPRSSSRRGTGARPHRGCRTRSRARRPMPGCARPPGAMEVAPRHRSTRAGGPWRSTARDRRRSRPSSSAHRRRARRPMRSHTRARSTRAGPRARDGRARRAYARRPRALPHEESARQHARSRPSDEQRTGAEAVRAADQHAQWRHTRSSGSGAASVGQPASDTSASTSSPSASARTFTAARRRGDA